MGCHTVYNTVDIFVLASQYLSRSVVRDRAAHRCRWFLSMSSCRPHNMQKGLSRRPIRWGCFPRQSCWTVSLKTATDDFRNMLSSTSPWTCQQTAYLIIIIIIIIILSDRRVISEYILKRQVSVWKIGFIRLRIIIPIFVLTSVACKGFNWGTAFTVFWIGPHFL